MPTERPAPAPIPAPTLSCPECGRPPRTPSARSPFAAPRTFLLLALVWLLIAVAALALHTAVYPDASHGSYQRTNPVDFPTGPFRIVSDADLNHSVWYFDRRVSSLCTLAQYGTFRPGLGAADLHAVTDRRLITEWDGHYRLVWFHLVRPHAIYKLGLYVERIAWTIAAILALAAASQFLMTRLHRRRESRRVARNECLHCRYPIRDASASE